MTGEQNSLLPTSRFPAIGGLFYGPSDYLAEPLRDGWEHMIESRQL